MAKVWVTHEKGVDFTAAEQFGEVQFLTNDDLNNAPNSLHNRKVIDALWARLQQVDQDDWFVIVGSPYVAAVVFLILGKMGWTRVRILRWSNRDRIYQPLEISIA